MAKVLGFKVKSPINLVKIFFKYKNVLREGLYCDAVFLKKVLFALSREN